LQQQRRASNLVFEGIVSQYFQRLLSDDRAFFRRRDAAKAVRYPSYPLFSQGLMQINELKNRQAERCLRESSPKRPASQESKIKGLDNFAVENKGTIRQNRGTDRSKKNKKKLIKANFF